MNLELNLEYHDDYEAKLSIKGERSETIEILVVEDGYRAAFDIDRARLLEITDEIRSNLGVKNDAPAIETPKEPEPEENNGPDLPPDTELSPFDKSQPTQLRWNATALTNAFHLSLGVCYAYGEAYRELESVIDLVQIGEDYLVIGHDAITSEYIADRLGRISNYVGVNP